MVTRRNQVGAASQDGDKLEHIVLVGRKYRRTGKLRCYVVTGARIEPLHVDENREYFVTLAEGGGSFGEGGNIPVVFSGDIGAGRMKINCPVLAFLESASGNAGEKLRDGCGHRPPERMDRAERKHRGLFVPASLAEHS